MAELQRFLLRAAACSYLNCCNPDVPSPGSSINRPLPGLSRKRKWVEPTPEKRQLHEIRVHPLKHWAGPRKWFDSINSAVTDDARFGRSPTPLANRYNQAELAEEVAPGVLASFVWLDYPNRIPSAQHEQVIQQDYHCYLDDLELEWYRQEFGLRIENPNVRGRLPPLDAAEAFAQYSKARQAADLTSELAAEFAAAMSGYEVVDEQAFVTRQTPISDPAHNVAREDARAAEADGLQVPNAIDNSIPGLEQSSPVSIAHSQQRQDFSDDKQASKEGTKLGNYYLGRTLGAGEFGKVKLGWRPGMPVQVAVKIIKKERLRDATRVQKIFREVNILTGLDHPNIVRLHEMIETDRYIGIVLEYAPCGELFNYILTRRYLPDKHASRLFAQLVSAVGYLHKKGIIHRDLKLENLLLDRNHNLIVTDFGFANTFDPNDRMPAEMEDSISDRSFVERNKLERVQPNGFRRFDLMSTSCGSPCYAAPELVISEGVYTGRKVDVWSIGVILYAMLAGYLPFDDDPRNPDGDNITLLYQYISTTELKFPDYVTPHARDLLKRMLVPNPRRRADLFEVARHSWLSSYENVVESITSDITTPAIISNAAASTSNERAGTSLVRSSSTREASNPASQPLQYGPLAGKHGNVGDMGDSAHERPNAQRTHPSQKKRQTVQVEYLPPRQAAEDTTAPMNNNNNNNNNNNWYEQTSASRSDPVDWRTQNARSNLWTEQQQNQGRATASEVTRPRPAVPSKDEPTTSSTRPLRAPERATTDPAFGTITSTRPTTQGSTGSRLPSRGSYGQPVAALVATASAQGHFSQPLPTGSAPYSAYGQSDGESALNANGSGRGKQPSSSSQDTNMDPSKQKRGHSRSHTLSDLTQKVFGRTPSVKRAGDNRPRTDRSHPPTSMKPLDSSQRKSSESRLSQGFGRKSTDFSNNSGSSKRNSKRFSFIPRWGNSKADLTPPATGEMGEVPRVPQAYTSTMDGTGDSGATRGQQIAHGESSQPPTSYSSNQPYSYNNSPVAAYHPNSFSQNVPAGNTSIQRKPLPHQNNTAEVDSPSRFESPATTAGGHNDHGNATGFEQGRAPWESDNWSSNKKFQQGKSGPAQRVMDFFRGRRQDRAGLVA